MPAVSKKQQRYFGYLLSNPEERKKKGISKKTAKDFAQDIQEVSPPGWGHTKAEKEKTKPWKPKSKIGGTAAAFKRALDDGRFKGLPGSTTKKEKTADMFKLMWSMKKKGDKPHYKPGTDKKYKKYQDESFEIDTSAHKKAQKKAKLRNLAKGNTNPNEKAAAEKKAGGPKLYGESISTKDTKKLNKASALDQSKDPKDWDSARARRTEIDYKDLMRQIKAKKKMRKESVENGKVDLTLKAGVNNVLKQDNKEYDRGLLAQVNKDGSYDVAYWYDKYKAYPVEVEIDGKTCAKDAKNIHIKFHPELKKEDWKPEIEHVKGSDLRKKAAEKKRKAAADSLPPHLRLDVMKKAFASTNEEVAMPHVSTKDKKAMAKRAKNLFTKDEEGTKQGVNEKTTMKDNNLFGDAYAGSYEKLKKKIGSKKMHNKPAIEENKFVDAMVSAVKKRKEEKKPEKAHDAGAKARRMLKRREHAKYVSGSEDNVPDDLRDHKNWDDFKKHI